MSGCSLLFCGMAGLEILVPVDVWQMFASHRQQLSEKFVFGFKIGPELIVAQAGLANPASVS